MATRSREPSRGPLPAKSPAGRERLAFRFGGRTVPGRGAIDAALAQDAEPTFATAPYAEPRDWGYAGLLAFTMVLLVRPQDSIRALEPFHLAELCAIASLAPMLLHRFARRLPVFHLTRESVGLAFLGAVMVGTAPFSIWPGGAFDVFSNGYLKVFIVFMLMTNTLTTPKRLERLTWLIVLCCAYVAGRGVVDYARGVNLIEGDRLAGPVSGILGNPNDLATNMVVFLPVAIVVAMARSHSSLRRLTAAGIAALMTATIIFTKSRSGGLGLALMLATLILLGRRVRPGFATITIVALLASAPIVPVSFWNRMQSIVDARQDAKEYTGSREARRTVMREGIETFLERPLTGVGAGQFVNYNPPGRQERWKETHNALIQIAADLGIFGLLAFSFLIICAALGLTATRHMLDRWKRDARSASVRAAERADRDILSAHSVAMSAALVGWVTCAMFASIAYSWTFYYMLALIVTERELVRHRLSMSSRVSATRTARLSVPRLATARPHGHPA
jgi:O-antigen ligase